MRGGELITFIVNGIEYQAEEGMTFYDWAMSKYYDDSCQLSTFIGLNLRDGIIAGNVSPGDAVVIFYGPGTSLIPNINTDTIIQPISYTPNAGGWN